MEKDEYVNLVCDPYAWMQQASQFFVAARFLVPHLKVKSPPTQDGIDGNLGALKGLLLFLAIAVENALKAIMAKQGKIVVINGKINKDCFGKKGGHDLNGLAKNFGISLDEEEKNLLKKLSEILLWAGKYQQPLDQYYFDESKTNNPRELTVPKEIEMVEKILNRAKNAVQE